MNSPELGRQRINEIRRLAINDFRREVRLRAVRLYLLFIPLAVCGGLMYTRWILQTDPQEKLLYAILFLLSFQGVMLVGVWLWLNPRVMLLLKEMKLLRLDVDRDSLEQGAGPSDSLVDVLQNPAIPQWAGKGGLVVALVAASLLAVRIFPPPSPLPAAEIRNFITLGDGESVESVSETKAPWNGMFPTSEIITYCDAECLAVQEGPQGPIYPGKITDDKGHELPVDTRMVNDGKSYEFTIHLPEQILPGQVYVLRERLTLAHFVKKEGDAWKVRTRANWGAPEAQYTFVYKMPKDASLVDGHPDSERQDDTAKYAVYKAVRRDGESFEFSFTYRTK